MAYKKIKSYELSESEIRNILGKKYCYPVNPIYTFDNILVIFNEYMFNHAFKESADRKKGDKSILSLNRCEKILWIKDALEDSKAIIKQGWDKRRKKYDNARRVALVKGNYIVVIRFIGINKAKFVTAYEVNEDKNLAKILRSPDFTIKK